MTPEERKQLAEDIAFALSAAKQPQPQLSDDELQWVRLAIEAEARKIRFRDAVIEKSLTGLVWTGLMGAGYVLLDFFRNHGLKL
jgi:hypothetical protein